MRRTEDRSRVDVEAVYGVFPGFVSCIFVYEREGVCVRVCVRRTHSN